MFRRNIRVRLQGFRKYKGSDQEVCRAIIEDCWNGRFFQVSAGHFQTFYARDFSWCAKPLIELGHRQRVESTLRFALENYRRHGRVRVAVTKKGKPFDFPRYAVDSLPSLMRSLRVLGSNELTEEYRGFLEAEVAYFVRKVVGKDGMVIKGHFSSIRDHYVHESSCYDNTMVAMLSQDLDSLGLKNPLQSDYPNILKQHFWNKDHFVEERGDDVITGESNIFPFCCSIFNDRRMIRKAVDRLRKEGLDKPFPLRYAKERREEKEIGLSFLANNYEGDAIWMHIGLIYIQAVKMVDKKLAYEYLAEYRKLIEKYMNFLEVFDKEGKPFRSPFYYTDESMLWCSIYLSMI